MKLSNSLKQLESAMNRYARTEGDRLVKSLLVGKAWLELETTVKHREIAKLFEEMKENPNGHRVPSRRTVSGWSHALRGYLKNETGQEFTVADLRASPGILTKLTEEKLKEVTSKFVDMRGFLKAYPLTLKSPRGNSKTENKAPALTSHIKALEKAVQEASTDELQQCLLHIKSILKLINDKVKLADPAPPPVRNSPSGMPEIPIVKEDPAEVDILELPGINQ